MIENMAYTINLWVNNLDACFVEVKSVDYLFLLFLIYENKDMWDMNWSRVSSQTS